VREGEGKKREKKDGGREGERKCYYFGIMSPSQDRV